MANIPDPGEREYLFQLSAGSNTGQARLAFGVAVNSVDEDGVPSNVDLNVQMQVGDELIFRPVMAVQNIDVVSSLGSGKNGKCVNSNS